MRAPITAIAALTMGCCTLGAAERLAGLPPLESMLVDLRSTDPGIRRTAQEYLYLLGLDDLVAVQADFDQKGGQRNADTIVRHMLLARGHRETVDEEAERILQAGGTVPSWTSLPPSHLTALADATATRMGRLREAPAARVSHWRELAAASGHPKLTKLALELVAQDGESLRVEADLAGGIVADLIDARDAERCVRLLGCLAGGWSGDVPRAIQGLARHPDARVRSALARSLINSTSNDALQLATRLLEDDDTGVRSAVFMVMESNGGHEWLGTIATDERQEEDLRRRAWARLAASADGALADEAIEVVTGRRGEGGLEDAALKYVIASGRAADLLDDLDRLDPDLQRQLLAALAAEPAPEVLRLVIRRVERSDDRRDAHYLLAALARSDAPAAVAAVIGLLDDRDDELRRLAGSALRSGTGRDGPVEEADAGRRRGGEVAKIWEAWFERYRSELAPEQVAQLDAAREAIERSADEVEPGAIPRWALLRLCAERRSRDAALQLLAADPDPAATAVIMSLIGDIEFATDRRSLLDPLRSRSPDRDALEAMRNLLDSDDWSDQTMAAQVLVAWRSEADAERLARAAIVDGTAFREIARELADWAHPDIQRVVDELLDDERPEAREGQDRALQVLMGYAGEEEVADLVGLVRRDPSAAARPAGLLARLALGGSQAASAALADLLTGRNEAVAATTLTQLVAEEQRSSSPDTGGRLRSDLAGALEMLAGDDRRGAATRSQALLVLARRGADAALPTFVAFLEAGGGAELAEGILAGRRAASLSFALELYRRGLFDQRQAAASWRWFHQVGGLPEVEVDRMRAEYDQLLELRQERRYGQPVRDLVVAIEPVTGTWSQDGEVELALTISNQSRQNVSLVPIGSFRVFYGSHNSGVSGSLPLEERRGRTDPQGTLVLRGRATLRFELTCRVPRTFNTDLVDARIRAEVELRIRDETDSDTITVPSAWQPLSLLPELWHKIDRRHR